MVLRIILILSVIALVLLCFTQVILPAAQGRLLFPLLRKSVQTRRQKLAEAHQDRYEAEIDKRISKVQTRAMLTELETQEQETEQFEQLLKERENQTNGQRN